MKKTVILLLCAVSALPALAQRGIESTFGVKAGANYSTVYAAGLDGVDGKIAPVAGVFGEFRIKKIGLQAELLYSREGYRTTHTATEPNYDLSASLNYLTIPVLIKAYANEQLSFDLGYQTGVLWNTAVRYPDDNAPDGAGDELANMRSVNGSLLFGATYRIGDHFDVSARYLLGVSDLENKLSGEMLRSRVGQLTVGYRF